MPYLEVRGIQKGYGGSFAVTDVSFAAEQGSIVALLGPSGCGKTTLLNLIAGFLRPDGGTIHVRGRDVTLLASRKRDMAMVFQSYALFPHLSVERNVAFGLQARRVRGAEQRRRIAEALDLVRLSHLADRYPHELSGGQQQRVSIARAAAVRPAVLLLDEPLSNLDTQLRKEMRAELRTILKQSRITAVLVTHDQEEALSIADLLVVLNAGHVEQIGTPRTVFEHPATAFCARFMDATNLIAGTVTRSGGSALLATPLGALRTGPSDLPVGAAADLVLRPEFIRLMTDDTAPAENRVAAVLRTATYLGTSYRLHCEAGGIELIANVPAGAALPGPGGTVHLGWTATDGHLVADHGRAGGP